MRQLLSLDLKPKMTKSISLVKGNWTVQSMFRSQKVNYQTYITWFYVKAILRKKILKSLLLYNIFKN